MVMLASWRGWNCRLWVWNKVRGGLWCYLQGSDWNPSGQLNDSLESHYSFLAAIKSTCKSHQYDWHCLGKSAWNGWWRCFRPNEPILWLIVSLEGILENNHPYSHRSERHIVEYHEDGHTMSIVMCGNVQLGMCSSTCGLRAYHKIMKQCYVTPWQFYSNWFCLFSACLCSARYISEISL